MVDVKEVLMLSHARALKAKVVQKVWGCNELPEPFAAPIGARVGEIWFDPPPEVSGLLVKYIFTSEKLSVQVHPADKDTPDGRCGKDECWLVLSAEPGARLAVGFRSDVSSEAMRAAAIDGTIEDLLAWHAVSPGDFVYLPARTVHAIGAGLTLIEVQQNSNVTFRLYDYGRPRELHVDAAVAVASGALHPEELRRTLPERGQIRLADGPHFRLDRLDGSADSDVSGRYGERPLLVVPLDGVVTIGETSFGPGMCVLAPSLGALDLESSCRALVVQPV